MNLHRVPNEGRLVIRGLFSFEVEICGNQKRRRRERSRKVRVKQEGAIRPRRHVQLTRQTHLPVKEVWEGGKTEEE